MNELIENNLMEHLEKIMLANSKLQALALFKTAIQIACKAQRNACTRIYEDYGEADEINYNKSKIKSAEIERQDYE